MQDRRQRPDRRVRFEEIRQEIATRLREACQGMAPDQCDALLSQMARLQLKYEIAGLPEMMS